MQALGLGTLAVVPPAMLEASIAKEDAARAAAVDAAKQAEAPTGLSAIIDSQFDMMRRHRDTQAGWSGRLLSALRAFNGEYDPAKLADIQKFGGSEIYARVIAMKCRGASALLRDVYLSPQKPWGLNASEDPEIPASVLQSVQTLVMAEVQGMAAAGQQVDVNQMRDRVSSLTEAARQAAKRKATMQAQISEDRIQEILLKGGFYKALAEFITDLPLFPFACMKGPVVRIMPEVTWTNGSPSVQQRPRLTWTRVSPFDLWFTPGVSDIEDASVIERTRVTRADLNDLLDLPGYDTDKVAAVLDEHGRGGLSENWDTTDSERATLENRENPTLNNSGLISCLEFHGNIQGRTLLESGMEKKLIPDERRDYFVQAWKIGRHIIKLQLAPSPRKRHPYFITSFEKVPGTPVGNGLPDILSDVQEASNATLRALVNNMSIASDPQVWVNEDRVADDEDGDDIYPWKRWRMKSDPLSTGNSQPPVGFFQPNSNAQELLAVYQKFVDMADELSAIPKYLSGGASGGAGRTASGLAMLMGNASKILQTVAANIDRDVMEPALGQLFDIIMLTDTTGLLTGEETVAVLGVNVATQRETQRSRQLEFLSITANPIDAGIIGAKGRATILRAVAQDIGLPGEQIVPDADTLNAMQAAQQPQGGPPGAPPPPGGPAQAGAQAQGSQGPQDGSVANGDQGPRTNLQAAQPGISGGVH